MLSPASHMPSEFPLLCTLCVWVASKAYIIKSRVRDGAGLLLVQPYSPELFRQGDLPGPRLLMEALRGEVTQKELKQKWKAVEKEKEGDRGRHNLDSVERL